MVNVETSQPVPRTPAAKVSSSFRQKRLSQRKSDQEILKIQTLGVHVMSLYIILQAPPMSTVFPARFSVPYSWQDM